MPAPSETSRLNLNPRWPFWLQVQRAASTEPLKSYRTEVLADNPSGYWRLGEPSGTNADDASPNNQDGTYVGAPTLAQAGALTFDTDTAVTGWTTGNYVTVPAATIPVTTGDYTMEAWFRYTGTAAIQFAFAFGNSAALTAVIGIGINAGAVQMFIRNNAATLLNPSSGALFNDDAFHHVVLAKGSGTARLYVDGVEVVNGTAPTGAYTLDTGAIGVRRAAGASQNVFPVAGVIDEVAVYPTALSPARILQHYLSKNGPAPAPTGGSTSPQAVTATVTSTATQQFQVGKLVTSTATSTASIIRQVGKAVTATATSTASIARQTGKAVTATVTSTATLLAQKVILKAVTATVTSTASIVKQVTHPLTATATSTATVVKQTAKLVSATVTSSATLTGIKVILKALTATLTSSATLLKQVGKPMTATTVTITASVVKRVNKTVTGNVTSTATLSALKVFLRTLTANVPMSATMVRQVGKPITATVTSTATLVRQVAKRVTATVTSTASLLALRVFLRTLSATVTSTATMSRRVGKTVSATATVAGSVTKRIGKTVTGLVSGLASLIGVRIGPDTADPNPLRIVYTEAASLAFEEHPSLSQAEPDRTVTHRETNSLSVVEQGTIVHQDRR